MKTTDNFPVRRSLIPTAARSRVSDFFFNQVGRYTKGVRGPKRNRGGGVRGVLRLFLLKNYSIIKFLNRLEIIRSDGGLKDDFCFLPFSFCFRKRRRWILSFAILSVKEIQKKFWLEGLLCGFRFQILK